MAAKPGSDDPHSPKLSAILCSLHHGQRLPISDKRLMRNKSSQSSDGICYSIMSSVSSDKIDKAASSLQRIKDEALQKQIQGATLKLAHTQETKEVVESWFNNKEQLKALEPLAKIPSQILNSWPILYPNKQRAGQSYGFGPSTYIVLIALADLNKENGLPTWQEGPQRMGKGEWTHFSGDKAHYFDKEGGGLAIVIQLDKAAPHFALCSLSSYRIGGVAEG